MINKVLVFGPYNSGTNLVQRIFTPINGHHDEVNLRHGGIRISKLVGGAKHSFLDLPRKINAIYRYDVLYIICYRNIYSWINSCLNWSYKIKINSEDDIDFYARKWSSLVEIYNEYYLMYINLIKKYRNVIFLNYSKLIEPEIGYKYLYHKIKKFRLYIRPNYFKYCLSSPSKYHERGKSVSNSSEAYIKEKETVKRLESNNDINSKLDLGITNFFKE